MKIAVSATAPGLDAEVDPRFGRCQYFIIVDPETMEFEALDNSNSMASGGAGISTAQMIADKGVEAVIVGPMPTRPCRPRKSRW
jgi:predicted Fe-Mo cluster-binding NifX family protein